MSNGLYSPLLLISYILKLLKWAYLLLKEAQPILKANKVLCNIVQTGIMH